MVQRVQVSMTPSGRLPGAIRFGQGGTAQHYDDRMRRAEEQGPLCFAHLADSFNAEPPAWKFGWKKIDRSTVGPRMRPGI
jgi:hypothetical protein